MKKSYFNVVLTLTCLLGLGISASAARNNAHSVQISDVVQIGSTTLKPGTYKVEWQGTGPAVQVSFEQNGKTVVTAPGTLKTNDDHITQDAIVTEATGGGTSTLKEIRFVHQKEALVFDDNSGGMCCNAVWTSLKKCARIGLFEEPGTCVRRAWRSSEHRLHAQSERLFLEYASLGHTRH